MTDWFERHKPAGYLVIFGIAFAVSFYIQFHGSFADPDSFYHARMAVLTREQGLVQNFPWLPYTVLADSYIDQHYLYHALLVPFVSIVNPLAGIKVATIVFDALLITVFYGLLRSFRVRGAWLYPLILLLTNPFMFRMGLAKTSALAVTLALVGLWLIFNYRIKTLFVFAWLYVWFYGGFSLLGVFAVASSVIGWLKDRWDERRSHWGLLNWIGSSWERLQRLRNQNASRHLAVVAAVVFGLLFGLVLNPTFPKNIEFYEYQLVKIGIINQQDSIGVGGEWYPYKITDLIPSTSLTSIVILLGLVAFALEFKRQSKRSWTLLALMLFFFAFTLKSRRYIEYYVPFALLFGAFAISDAWLGQTWANLKRDIGSVLKRGLLTKALFGLLIVYLVVAAAGVGLRDLTGVRRDLASGQSYQALAASSGWLKTNAVPNSIILHSDWDEFPLLFYHDTTHRYIAGLDATFLYDKDPDRYWAWVKITTGQADPATIHQTVRQTLAASYVILTKDHTAMDGLLKNTSGFRLVYEDSEAKIYRVAD